MSVYKEEAFELKRIMDGQSEVTVNGRTVRGYVAKTIRNAKDIKYLHDYIEENRDYGHINRPDPYRFKFEIELLEADNAEEKVGWLVEIYWEKDRTWGLEVISCEICFFSGRPNNHYKTYLSHQRGY